MSQRRPVSRDGAALSLVAIGSIAERLGVFLLVAALPLTVGTAAGLVTDAASPAAGLQLAFAAMNSQVTLGTSVASLFQLSSLAALAGCWILGVGLLLDGLFE